MIELNGKFFVCANQIEDMRKSYRTPIVSLLGHVDHGKTTILDTLSGKSNAEDESGGITQTVRIVELSNERISDICADSAQNFDYKLPGLLFVDTPGHRAFRESRRRGSSMSDIAVLVVDIKNGFQPQTHEAIEYLKETQTPFVVAVNKVDALPEWDSTHSGVVSDTFHSQSDRAKNRVRDSVYEIAGEISDHDLSSDFYWNVNEFTKNIGLIPISAETKEGIPDLVSIISGLSQRYLQDKMRINVSGSAKGQIIGTNNHRGFGNVIDILLEDGSLELNDNMYVGTRKGIEEVQADKILSPAGNEMSSDTEFERITEATAARILRLPSEVAEEAIVGSPMSGTRDDMNTWDGQEIQTVDDGIVVRASSTDSLRAVAFQLNEYDVPVLHANVGDVKKIDVRRAQATKTDKNKIIASFSTDIHDKARNEAKDSDIDIVESEVVYKLVEKVEKARQEKEENLNPTSPCRLEIVDDGIIKKGDPAIIGVEVKCGILENNVCLSTFRNSSETVLGEIKKMEVNFEGVETASQGDKVSISVSKSSAGTEFIEGQSMYTKLSSEEAQQLSANPKLGQTEQEALEAYIDKKKQRNPFWP